ncbi:MULTISPECIES: hypothetical protein [Microbacterium]|uniref:hypothetical protein n=1 Tax=Microbacterium TaxID=33882 RepID=UPI000F5D6ABF|nr:MULTISPECIES: hypothetical protein [Microbacterium]AZH79161.1 hypothetical protein CSX12_12245 [Microbacterium sp. Y-01]MBM7465006.1 hypothetical protein [Microbacterium esteraromaticum]
MTFVETLKAAKDTRVADDYISRVKSAVSAELESLDSSAVIEDTSYFNHSAIPDLVLTWPRERATRAIFLRHSYQSVVDADDVDYLAERHPVFMSLDTREREDSRAETVLRETASSVRTLVTDPTAVDVIRGEESSGSPLADLVRANFIRGGRGLIDEGRATSLVESTQAAEPTARELLISESFSEDAAARITRTSQLIALALDPDFSLLDGEESPLVGGKLSIAELRHLVPWLLRQDAAIENTQFWRHLGDYVTFAELENIRADLADMDLTPLVKANAGRWSAKWAYVGVATPVEGDETYSLRSDYWSFRNGGALGIDVEEQRLSLAHNGQLASKGRDGTSSATWERIKDAVASDRLARIDLRGITRSVILNAERSPDIRSDIQKVTDSLDDSYTVNEVVLRTKAPQEDGTTEIEVKFDNALVIAASGASIADLARVSLQVLNYRTPVTDEVVGGLFDETAPADESNNG